MKVTKNMNKHFTKEEYKREINIFFKLGIISNQRSTGV